MKVHWHLGYSKLTACGITAYPGAVTNEFHTRDNWIIECADEPNRVTCARCKRTMMLGKFGAHLAAAPPATKPEGT